jgi:hypothetical protein
MAAKKAMVSIEAVIDSRGYDSFQGGRGGLRSYEWLGSCDSCQEGH